MAAVNRARLSHEPKELKLVCKCGDCRSWEIVLVHEKPVTKDGNYARSHEYLECMSCGVKFPCYFSIGAHEGLHYERHGAKE